MGYAAKGELLMQLDPNVRFTVTPAGRAHAAKCRERSDARRQLRADYEQLMREFFQLREIRRRAPVVLAAPS